MFLILDIKKFLILDILLPFSLSFGFVTARLSAGIAREPLIAGIANCVLARKHLATSYASTTLESSPSSESKKRKGSMS